MYVLARNAPEHLGRCKLVGLHIHTGGYQSVRPTPKGECVGEALFFMGEKMIDGPCILHKGATCDGYGVKKFNRKTVRSHRLAYCQEKMISLEAISGKIVMHLCDNRLCVNPKHLKLGTHAENCADKVQKGRQARGEKGGNAKLKDAEVHEIISMIKAGDSNNSIAKAYGVSLMCISRIRAKKTWRHLWAA